MALHRFHGNSEDSEPEPMSLAPYIRDYMGLKHKIKRLCIFLNVLCLF